MDAKSGIYAVRNTRTGLAYIGGSANLERRRKDHWRMLRGGYHFALRLQSAWDQHGEAAFRFELLEPCEPQRLVEREQRYIDRERAWVEGCGYNSRPTADTNRGHRFRPETVERNRLARIGVKQSPETVAKRTGGQRGRKRAESAIEATAIALRGVPRPDVGPFSAKLFRKFRSEEALKIRSEVLSGRSMRSVAQYYTCTVSTVHRIVHQVGIAYSG